MRFLLVLLPRGIGRWVTIRTNDCFQWQRAGTGWNLTFFLYKFRFAAM